MLDLKGREASSTCQLWPLEHPVNQRYYGNIMMVNRARSRGLPYSLKGSISRGWGVGGWQQPCHCRTEVGPSVAQRKGESSEGAAGGPTFTCTWL